ncbi:hypothetical protein VTN49DRAFT_5399 [Thermomyces lanuginosus]|uniref:uncharacterized protein n=1 Tax=Thermomyces lanuginosus TaxID=5541 RepID=UPI0037435FBA
MFLTTPSTFLWIFPILLLADFAAQTEQDGKNWQLFTGSLGTAAPAITSTGDSMRPYGVNGETFADLYSAAVRSCSLQWISCEKIAETGNEAVGFPQEDCHEQRDQCLQFQQQIDLLGFPESAASGNSVTSSTARADSEISTSSSHMEPTQTAKLAQTVITRDDYILLCDL